MYSAFVFDLMFLSLVAGSSFYPGAGNHFGIPNQNATYDYVIVGGGTAGLAVAMRLAEDGCYTVVVVEAGGFYQIESGNQSVVPAYNPRFSSLYDPTAFPATDWGFITTPQTYANNRSLHYARGKTLGGSSALNANIYNRGTRGSYQAWADHVGDSSYEFDNWLPFFAKGTTYNFANTTLRAANASVPTPVNLTSDYSDGPVQISYSNYALPFTSWANLAFRAFGFGNISSFSDGALLGSQYAPSILKPDTNQRETSSSSYLKAAFDSGLDNLKVYTHTLAMRILFSPNLTATSVEVRTGTRNYFLTAKKEIILSAGAIQSPQLLMVSGIGPSATLASHNITVLADRPGVGQYLWDHVDIEATWKVGVDGFNTLNNVTYASLQAALFAASSNGTPYSSIYGSYGADYIAWEKLPEAYRANLSDSALQDLATFASDWPEVEYEIGSIYQSMEEGDYNGYGTFVIVPVSPLSRGTVTLQTASMLDPPIIDPAYLSAETDREVALQALKRGRDILSSEAMQPILIGTETAPGKEVQTDDELNEYIRENLFMNWHAACTCRMGKVNDTMAVVDSKARVIGVQNLRIVDASAFALLPPGHPTSTVYGLAEKISADIIAAR